MFCESTFILLCSGMRFFGRSPAFPPERLCSQIQFFNSNAHWRVANLSNQSSSVRISWDLSSKRPRSATPAPAPTSHMRWPRIEHVYFLTLDLFFTFTLLLLGLFTYLCAWRNYIRVTSKRNSWSRRSRRYSMSPASTTCCCTSITAFATLRFLGSGSRTEASISVLSNSLSSPLPTTSSSTVLFYTSLSLRFSLFNPHIFFINLPVSVVYYYIFILN